MASEPVVDVCVHHEWATQAEVMEYMSSDWQEYIGRPGSLPGGRGARPLLLAFPWYHPQGGLPPERRGAASDPAEMRAQLLDAGSVDRCVLSYRAAMYTPAMTNPHLAHEIARAANDWTIDRWLSADPRFHGLVLAPNQMPERAAEEIRRVGEHPQMVGVLMAGNGIGKPFGHPLCLPIYEAAAELGLPVVIHAGGDAVPDATTQTAAGGLPATFGEYRALAAQSLMTHLVSLVGQGVFERLPELRVVFAGAGVAWIPSLLWRFDTNYKGFRRETPWVKEHPSAYFRRHARVATFPLDAPQDRAGLIRSLEAFRGLEDVLCYGSGFPDRDSDLADEVRDALPEDWRRRVMHDNADALFPWPRATVGVAS
jgi:predicted TIM-barrel fold metal-dependent hydrolase